MIARPVPFLKGHGTENDFVLLPDAEGLLRLAGPAVRMLCDRRRGVGADGVLRVVLAGQDPDGVAMSDEARWFMDHRNADGSTAEMCGNGLRLFARYLLEAGLLGLGEHRIATRAGVRRVVLETDASVTVDMGPARWGGSSTAEVAGRSYPGVAVSMGNPHLVVAVDGPLADLDLSRAPTVVAADFPAGVNVEFVLSPAEPAPGPLQVAMRVFERGVGETRACGTGAAAVGVVSLAGRSGTVAVDQPGGRVLVTVDEQTTYLRGPAVIVARGELDAAWFARTAED